VSLLVSEQYQVQRLIAQWQKEFFKNFHIFKDKITVRLRKAGLMSPIKCLKSVIDFTNSF